MAETVQARPVVEVEIPTTAHEWELYEDVPQADEAAEEITAALKIALTTCDTRRAAERMMDPIMRKWDHAGAGDSEPQFHLRKALRQTYGGD